MLKIQYLESIIRNKSSILKNKSYHESDNNTLINLNPTNQDLKNRLNDFQIEFKERLKFYIESENYYLSECNSLINDNKLLSEKLIKKEEALRNKNKQLENLLKFQSDNQ